VSRIVTFIIKNIKVIILFSCLVGWLVSSHVKNYKKLRHNPWHSASRARIREPGPARLEGSNVKFVRLGMI